MLPGIPILLLYLLASTSVPFILISCAESLKKSNEVKKFTDDEYDVVCHDDDIVVDDEEEF